MFRMQIKLTDEEREALRLCATHERREMREQAAVLIRLELERRGLVSAGAEGVVESEPGQIDPADGGQRDNA